MFDFIVVGGGIAGFSVAAGLSRAARVLVPERESRPGCHATGRSAALYGELYGNATIRALIRASRAFLFEPPEGFSANPLVSSRGTLYFAEASELAALDAFAQMFDEYDIAVDGFEQATARPVKTLRSRWAGLRTFPADKTPVVGFDPVVPGFFLLVGQGGCGIQSSPAMARAAAALARGEPLPEAVSREGVCAAALAPRRWTIVDAA